MLLCFCIIFQHIYMHYVKILINIFNNNGYNKISYTKINNGKRENK